MIDGLLLPDVDDPESAPFWAGCAVGELRVQVCARCGRRRMPPRPMCPTCQSFEHVWEVTDGRGTIWSFVVSHPPLLPAYAEQTPYNVVVVALDADPAVRFVGNVVREAGARLDSVDPTTISIGQPVRAVFGEVAEGVWLPQWVAA